MDSDAVRWARRSSPRLGEYDYSQEGYYFVTICTIERRPLFGSVSDGRMNANGLGEAVVRCWQQLPDYHPYTHLDAYVLMPNHVHGIIAIHEDVTEQPRHGLSEIVRGFKSRSARAINRLRGGEGKPVWQRSFYDHVVRSDADLARIQEYVAHNPEAWEADRFYG